MAKSKEVQKVETPAGIVVAGDDQVPDYIKQGGNRGNENVRVSDLVVPRLEIAQALSPCLDESNEAAYIEGAKQGMLFNSLTRALYGSSAILVPIIYHTMWLLWRDRDNGGGFGGAYLSLVEAKEELQRRFGDEPNELALWEPVETGQHLCLLVGTRGIEEIMVSMSRTKLKISRQWNSLIRQGGGDRFSRAYTISGTKERNTKNQEYYNFTVKFAGFPTQEVYGYASELYERIVGGEVNVVMDTSDVDAEAPESTDY